MEWSSSAAPGPGPLAFRAYNAAELRRLDADEIYQAALEGIEKVQYG